MERTDRIARLRASLAHLCGELQAAEGAARLDRRALHPDHRPGATNLLHYLELRRHDIRGLQDDLAHLGLSSLGRAESHVLASLEQVSTVLGVLADARPDGAVPAPQPPSTAPEPPSIGPAPKASPRGGARNGAPDGQRDTDRDIASAAAPSVARDGARAGTQDGHRDAPPSAAPHSAADGAPAAAPSTALSAAPSAAPSTAPQGAVSTAPSAAPSPSRRLLSGAGLPPVAPASLGFDEGRRRLARNAAATLGPAPAGRTTRIMVTLPSEAAADPALVRDLMARGMDCARVNCAHDDPPAWEAMIAHVRAAAGAAGRPCPVVMDLAGPKLRTSGLPSAPGVVKLRPERDRLGRTVAAAQAWLLDPGDPGAPPREPWLPVADHAWLDGLRQGSAVDLRDARGRRRTLRVTGRAGGRVGVETERTCYLVAGTALRATHGEGRVGPLPPETLPLVLRPGDHLTLDRDGTPGPGRIGCTLPEVIGRLRRGHRVWFDDGRIGGIITAVRADGADIEVTAASPGGSRLRPRKSINLPDTDLHLPAVTPADEAALPFVAAHADLVGMSFVHRPEDVLDLQARLDRLGAAGVGVVLKVETSEAFTRLPDLMLAAMANPRVAVMIARGDLAVESGWERLAEVQEEILWLAEAAHLPVIWATEVLDRLARTGKPSRPEITDAAMSQRAECVMLNKGPHIATAVETLDNILRLMSAHQAKKSALLRRLRSWPD